MSDEQSTQSTFSTVELLVDFIDRDGAVVDRRIVVAHSADVAIAAAQQLIDQAIVARTAEGFTVRGAEVPG